MILADVSLYPEPGTLFYVAQSFMLMMLAVCLTIAGWTIKQVFLLRVDLATLKARTEAESRAARDSKVEINLQLQRIVKKLDSACKIGPPLRDGPD